MESSPQIYGARRSMGKNRHSQTMKALDEQFALHSKLINQRKMDVPKSALKQTQVDTHSMNRSDGLLGHGFKEFLSGIIRPQNDTLQWFGIVFGNLEAVVAHVESQVACLSPFVVPVKTGINTAIPGSITRTHADKD